jgi:ABC-type multidrug transport system fused ATPase/permease subunit
MRGLVSQVHVMVLIAVLLLASLPIACDLLLKLWLTRWINAQQAAGSATFHFAYYAAIYVALALTNTLIDSVKDISFRLVQFSIGTRVHAKLVASLLRAPMDFFHSHPTGILLNRLSSDTATADLSTTFPMANFVQDAITLVSTLLFISGACLPTLLFLVPACVGYVATQQLCVTPSRDLDRLMSNARSPTVSIFKEALGGTPFIRAAGLEVGRGTKLRIIQYYWSEEGQLILR